jgi:hypothetical protein
MKKILFVWCVLFLNSAVADWIPFLGYSNDDPAMLYVDADKIEKKNNIAKLWEKTVFRKIQTLEGSTYKVRVTLSEYDCKKKEVKVVYAGLYKDEAMQEPLWFGNVNYNAIPITPGSYAETTGELACTYSPKKKKK